MNETLFLDIESFSECDLRAAGPYVYAEHPSTELLLFAFAVDDGPVHVWDATVEPMPKTLASRINNPDVMVVVHNAGFERPVLSALLGMDTNPTRWHDTMAQAMTLALPASLEKLGDTVGLSDDQAKIKDGKRLVQKFCKPAPKNHRIRRHTRETDPEDWRLFIEYARMDVASMRDIYHRLPTWVYRGRERETWELDQRINDRGFYVDLELARRAIEAVDAAQYDLAHRVDELTGGAVSSPLRRDVWLRYVRDQLGVTLPDAREATLLAALEGDLPAQARELIQLRLKASRTSTAKYQAAIEATGADNRLRGGLQYYGASRTGRWSGRRLQAQNLPRPSMGDAGIAQAIDAIKHGAADLVHADVMQAASDCIRSLICATPGHKLVVSDLSNIEGRALAWQALEDWKLDAFAAFDRGEGPDLYKVTAGSILGKSPGDVTKDERQVMGKVPELALGFGGGVGAFQSMANIYGVDMGEYWPIIRNALPDDVLQRAQDAWNTRGKISGLPKDEWLASEAVKIAWRDRHPETVGYWRDCEDAVRSAILQPGADFRARRLVYRRYKQWLICRLPSGRCMIYPMPRIKQRTEPSVYGEIECVKCKGEGCAKCEQAGAFSQREVIQFRAVNYGGWRWETTYGGKLAQGATQAIARDVLREGLHAAEDAGYRPVMTVHDEIVCDPPECDDYTERGLSAMLATVPEWAQGMPLAAEGYESYRFKKD